MEKSAGPLLIQEMTVPHPREYSDAILDTVEAFLETNPLLEGQDLRYDERMTGEEETVRMQHVYIDGVKYLFQAKKVGGARG